MPPGRTEIGGNHTDHQHGRVLAGSVNIDMIAAAAPNSLNQLRVQSEGYDLCVIDLDDLTARKEEEKHHRFPAARRVRGFPSARRKAVRSGRVHFLQRAQGQRRFFLCRL